MDLFGTEVVIQGMVGENKMEITARAVASGSQHLPDELYEPAASGVLTLLRAFAEERRIKNPEHLQRALREGHQGVAVMAKDPHDNRSSICWKPALTTVRKI